MANDLLEDIQTVGRRVLILQAVSLLNLRNGNWRRSSRLLEFH